MPTSPTRSIDLGSYFANVGLKVEDPAVEVPPSLEKKKIGYGKGMNYKYTRAGKVLANLATTIREGDAGALSCRLRIPDSDGKNRS